MNCARQSKRFPRAPSRWSRPDLRHRLHRNQKCPHARSASAGSWSSWHRLGLYSSFWSKCLTSYWSSCSHYHYDFGRASRICRGQGRRMPWFAQISHRYFDCCLCSTRRKSGCFHAAVHLLLFLSAGMSNARLALMFRRWGDRAGAFILGRICSYSARSPEILKTWRPNSIVSWLWSGNRSPNLLSHWLREPSAICPLRTSRGSQSWCVVRCKARRSSKSWGWWAAGREEVWWPWCRCAAYAFRTVSLCYSSLCCPLSYHLPLRSRTSRSPLPKR